MKDPMKGFRGVMSAMLLLEAIVLLLAVLLLAKRDDIGQGEVWAVGVLGLAMVALCAFVRQPWALGAALGMQGLLVLGFLITPAIGIIGVLFSLAWGWVTWMRQDVLKRMAEGRLPGQQ
ncbi:MULTISPECIES: DUF4233 domain-containing protein [Actinokineospora]|uniref:DUF4233 domain-containing protein n=1 Tax=Actinokineospora fastidiosa TaxID=1816 RepID=A0A918GLS1_9PSEU|nr:MULTISPECIES: DUF4233 domain-containing protein [Actinokineospora]UVS77648.1 hypothetical protein Actkin_01367 [Actinokineospora sp. UTMC 2448]GGS41969.1 hypothetical protein GCM10010171_40910 [Actinokineospora fastidiosa]